MELSGVIHFLGDLLGQVIEQVEIAEGFRLEERVRGLAKRRRAGEGSGSELAAMIAGLESFSHLTVIFYFHAADPAKIELSARHPRNNPAWPKAGIFAQRGKNRPNHLGVSACRILKVDSTCIHVQGLDAIDGTPVLDLKPYMRAFEARGEIKEPAWAGELMSNYW